MPLSKKVNISVGGGLREQLQYYHHINFGDLPPGYKVNTGQLWHRLMAHTNIELGKRTRMFTQISSTYRFINPNPLTQEIDQNKLSLHQVFVDHKFNQNWMVRFGRQEMSYGSYRLITLREGPNTILSFDAAVFKYKGKNINADVFAISPVISKKGVFDDQSFKDLAAGVYANSIATKSVSVDYYFLHFHSNRRQYNFVAGTESREIFGFRLFSKNKKMNYITYLSFKGSLKF